MKRLFLILVLILGGLGCFAVGWTLRPLFPDKEPLPVLGTVPNYTLTDQLGHRVSSTAFAGKVRVVTFLFPYCTSYCPLIAHNFVSLANVLKTSGIYDHVQLVAFNVDAGNAGPGQLRTFQKEYGWNPEDTHWEYLTGKPEEVRHIVHDSYHIYYEKVSTKSEDRATEREKKEGTYVPELVVGNKLAEEAKVDYDIVHNDAMVIVDAKGRIRKYFHEANRVSNEQIMHVIDQLLPSGRTTTAR
jgi:protein SCO1/2